MNTEDCKKTGVSVHKTKIRISSEIFKNSSEKREHNVMQQGKNIGKSLTFDANEWYTIMGKKVLSVTDGIVEHHMGAGGLFLVSTVWAELFLKIGVNLPFSFLNEREELL